MLLSGKARLAGVMGWPVGHSLSPRLHGHWIERHGLDAAYVLTLLLIGAGILASLLEGLGFTDVSNLTGGFSGWSAARRPVEEGADERQATRA